MYIEIKTEELSEGDAFALAVLILQQHPSVMSRLSFMTTAAHAALNVGAPIRESVGPGPSAEEAFGEEGAPPSVAPSAEAAFAGPQSAGAPVSDQVVQGAPVVATPPASPSDFPGEVDADGLPWDGRINSGGRAKNSDGRWKKKQGVGAEAKAAVQAELRARLAALPLASSTAGAPPPPVSDAPTSSTTPTISAVPAAPASAIAPPPPAVPAATAPAAPPAPASAISVGAAPAGTVTFPPEVARAAEAAVLAEASQPPAAPSSVVFTDVMRKVTDYTLAGKLTPDELTQVCVACGFDSPRDLLLKPALAPSFVQTLDAFVASKG